MGSLTEVAFYHRPTRTLLLTDAVVLVPPEPPAVVQRRDLLLAGGNPWYTAVLYGVGDETKVCFQTLIPSEVPANGKSALCYAGYRMAPASLLR